MPNYKKLDCDDSYIRSVAYTTFRNEIIGLEADDTTEKISIPVVQFNIKGLTKYLDSYTIESLQLISVGPNSTTSITATSNQPTYCMLMLPILGIRNISVNWYKRSGVAVNKVNNELVFNPERCYNKEKVALDKASLVKTFIPFSLTNSNPYKSVILAVRFKDEPVFLLSENIARVVK